MGKESRFTLVLIQVRNTEIILHIYDALEKHSSHNSCITFINTHSKLNFSFFLLFITEDPNTLSNILRLQCTTHLL